MTEEVYVYAFASYPEVVESKRGFCAVAEVKGGDGSQYYLHTDGVWRIGAENIIAGEKIDAYFKTRKEASDALYKAWIMQTFVMG